MLIRPIANQTKTSAPDDELVGLGLYDDKRSPFIPDTPTLLSQSMPSSFPRKSLVLEEGWHPPPIAQPDAELLSSDEDDFSLDEYYEARESDAPFYPSHFFEFSEPGLDLQMNPGINVEGMGAAQSGFWFPEPEKQVPNPANGYESIDWIDAQNQAVFI